MKKYFSIIVLVFSMSLIQAQNVGIGTNTPTASAKLEISSNTSGFLPPRMTTSERNGINNPAVGLMIYNTTNDCLEIFGKGKWNAIYCIPTDTTLLTDIDGHTYPTVKICNQTWMAKNLDVARYRNGDIIPQVTDPTQWANLTTGAWCWYNNDSANGAIYGRLYNWYAVNDPRGLAPEGWHVTSNSEWDVMTKCLDQSVDTTCSVCWSGTSIASQMKNSTGWNSGNGSNSSGFSGLPGGDRIVNGNFRSLGVVANWWSKSEKEASLAWNRILESSYNTIARCGYGKSDGLYVRCVKDAPSPTTLNNGLVAYYPFNGNANDESGNGNNGVVNGATLTTDRFGNSGKAYEFDGNSGNIKINSIGSSSFENDFSFSFWCNFYDFDRSYPSIIWGENTFIGIAGTGPDYIPNIKRIVAQQGPVLNIPQRRIPFFLTQTILNTNTFYHVSFVKNNSVAKIYVNGVYDTSVSVNNSLPVPIGNYLLFGADMSTFCPYPLHGKIDDIRIYNRALTQEEITYLAGH